MVVTLIVGWADALGAHLFADSAATHGRPPRYLLSSFGERQKLDSFTVEESAMKLAELKSGLVVGVCGDVAGAAAFLSHLLIPEVTARGVAQLRPILHELNRAAADRADPFQLVFMHQIDGRPLLTGFSSSQGTEELQKEMPHQRSVIIGSLPPHLLQTVARGVSAVRGLAPPRHRHMVVSAFLQSLGILEFLPEHQVGGAIYSAQMIGNEVTWQEDITHVLFPPRMLAASPLHDATQSDDDFSYFADGMEKVRCFMDRDIGFVLSSMSDPQAKALLPLHSDPALDWNEVLPAMMPEPRHFFGESRYVAFLSKMHRRVAVVIRERASLASCSFGVENKADRTLIRIHSDLVKVLEAPVPAGMFEIVLAVDDGESSTSVTGVQIELPS